MESGGAQAGDFGEMGCEFHDIISDPNVPNYTPNVPKES